MRGRVDGRLEVGPCPLVRELHDGAAVDPRVVDVDGTHARVLRHPLAVRAHGFQHGMASLVAGERSRPGCHDEARRQAHHVPFPRTGQRLVEVVDVEEEVPLRRGEEPEVDEVRVAADLDA